MELETNLAKLFHVEETNQELIENFAQSQSPEIFTPENPTPNNPPWNSGITLLVWAASVAFIVILPGLFVIPYILNQGIELSDSIQLTEYLQNNPTAILLNVFAVIPAHILTLVLAWMMVTKFNEFSFRQTLGWRWGGFNWWNCFIIIGGFFLLAAVVSYYFPEQDNELLRILRSSRAAVYLVAFLATFTAPLVEEVVYRGVLYSALQRTFGISAGVFLVTLLFALVHVPQYYPSYSTIFLICLLSLILTLVRVRTGNLLPCIVLHTIFNGIQSLLLILQPFLPENIGGTSEQSAALIGFFT
ncbi:MAG: CPBP family intramembrane metalloprotease [Acidobacteriota bacterium]|nr:CPBP family intramembrane metalloprotease [Acidobacteriota bacterium]